MDDRKEKLENTLSAQQDELQSPARRITLGYLAPSISDSIGLLRWRGVLDVAQERDVNLFCFPGWYWRSSEPHGQANVLYDLASSQTLQGPILGNILQEDLVDRAEFKRFYDQQWGLPAVSLRETVEGIPYIPLDNYHGMYEALVHLIEVHGMRRIAFLRGPEGHPYADERYQAYLDVLQEYDLPFNPDLVTPSSDWNAPSVQVLLDERQLLPPADFEAVVAANDRKALDALSTFQARGFHVPGDVAVVGFNDDAEDAAVTPPLTSVAMPSYEQGRRATERLLAMLEGEREEEQVPLRARLIVRQSCGCLSPNVLQAAAGQARAGRGDLEAAVQGQREQILAELKTATRDSEIAAQWAERLLDALVAEVSGGSQGEFLSVLNQGLHREVLGGGSVTVWQGLVSALRRQLLPSLGKTEALSRADDLWQQARVLVCETVERAQMYRTLEVERQAEMLQGIGETLAASFEIGELTESLTQNLPQLGISSCYLSLYEDPESPVQGSRLIMAYGANGKIELDPEGWRFPSTQLAPEGLLSPQRRYTFVVEPLYFQESHLGFISMSRFSPPKADRLKPRALARRNLSAAVGGTGFSPQPPSFQLGVV